MNSEGIHTDDDDDEDDGDNVEMDIDTENANGGEEVKSGKRKAKRSDLLRTGKWSEEEEEYAIRLIEDFKLGILSLTEGTNLRTFLSTILNCNPMRISKKFMKDKKVGKVRTCVA